MLIERKDMPRGSDGSVLSNLGGLRRLGKHDLCYSGTVWCAVRRKYN